MLSFLYRLVQAFRQEHGYRPNVVVMNAQHYQQLVHALPEMQDYGSISRFLMLEVILSDESVHPHVGWMPQVQSRSSTG